MKILVGILSMVYRFFPRFMTKEYRLRGVTKEGFQDYILEVRFFNLFGYPIIYKCSGYAVEH